MITSNIQIPSCSHSHDSLRLEIKNAARMREGCANSATRCRWGW